MSCRTMCQRLWCRYLASKLGARPKLKAPSLAGIGTVALFCCMVFVSSTRAAVDADLLLHGGTIFDGSGNAGFVGDVAISGARIAGVGVFEIGNVKKVIDCTGLFIAPGFIDLHTHSDVSIHLEDGRENLNYLTQGCTTVVTGNCGDGAANVAEFLGAIDRHGAGTNVIHLIPHGGIRHRVMGNANRAPSPRELAQMKKLVDRAMRHGAWGISTGLIYEPSAYANVDELVELSRVVAEHGGLYVTHMRSEGDALCEAVRETVEIGQRAELPVHISHFKICGKSNWGHLKDAVEIIEAARARGQTVTADQYPYIATSTSLFSLLMPVAEVPGGWENLSQRMNADSKLARHVSQLIHKYLDRSERVVIDSCRAFPQYNGRSVREIAAAEGVDEVELVMKIHRGGPTSAVNFVLSEEDVRYAMQLPWVATASDGRARRPSATERFHPRNFGTFPRKIGHYALREQVLPVAQAIRSATGLPADILNLSNRGYLRRDMVADVLVFDPHNFVDRATFEEPTKYTTGVRYLFVSGQLALQNGQLGDALHGRAIRHPASANRNKE
jgi:N-acyl-D-amino-acid deacylase